MRIGIIIGSIREGRTGEAVGHWVAEQARSLEATDIEVEVLDLRAFGLPLLESATVPGAANRSYDDDRVTRWSEAIDACDGFVFVTPEYNHSIPGAFKNAFDSIYPEWSRKGVTFVGYGWTGALRAVEHWRGIVANGYMLATRGQVGLLLGSSWTDGAFTPSDRDADTLGETLAELVDLTRAGEQVRSVSV